MGLLMLFREQVLTARRSRLSGDVILTNSHTTWIFLGVLFALLASGVTWLALGDFARTEQVQGFLRPNSGLIHLAPAVNGRVTAVSVAIGDIVEADTKLAEVKRSNLTGDGLDSVKERLSTLSKQIESAKQALVLDQQEATRRSKTLSAEIAALDQEIAALKRQAESQAALLQISNERLDKLIELADSGFATDVDLKALRTESLNHQRGLDQIAQQRSSLQREQILKRDQLAAITPDLTRREIETDRLIADLTSQRLDLTSQSGQTLTAPVAAEVVAITSSEGTMTSAGQTLLSLRPVNSQLQARLMVPSSAIGFLQHGQPVKMQFAAFPYERFGSHDGSIISIGKALVCPPSGPMGPKLVIA